ncbi:hypothetical protein Tco_1130147 [Tanacetum coccineum]
MVSRLRKLPRNSYGDYQCTQAEEMERNRVHEETMQMLREMIKIQEEKRIFEEAAWQKEEKRIAKEKEAAELEAKRKSQECLNIEEKSIPQASIRSRKFTNDASFKKFHKFLPNIDLHCFNAESNLIESLLNRDTLIDSSPKFDYLLEEFFGELAHSDPIPPGVVDTDSEPEEEIRLADNLSDSLMEEIDLFLASDYSMPPGIEIDDYDSEGDICFLEELLSSDSPPLPKNESFSLDHFDDPSL